MNEYKEGSGLETSFTDLMTSLAVIFILLLVASLNNSQQEGQDTKNAILLRLQEKLKNELRDYREQGFEVKNDPKDPLGLIVLVPEGLLNFAVNKAIIPAKGTEFLNTIIPKLSSAVCSREFKNDIDSIVVEGHTDSSGNDNINLPLSQQRSMAVVQASLSILQEVDKSSIEKQRGCFLKFVSATGRGSVEPILNNQGIEDQNKSRRVVFKIRIRSLEQKVLKNVIPLELSQ